jgi:DNA replication protein DnaD
VKEIVEFWDNNGFCLSNVNTKEQLLSWLDDSSFLQPKDVSIKAVWNFIFDEYDYNVN